MSSLPAARHADAIPSLSPERVKIQGLGKRYEGRIALADVDLAAHAGEFVAVLGPSGAGKTTLFRCIAGLTTPDAGSVRLSDLDITAYHGRQRRGLAVVFQQFNLIGRVSAIDNVLAGRLGHVAAWRGWVRRFEHRDRLIAFECLERVGLLDKAEQRADTLSGGQKQRVAIARALAQQPQVIVADEPVASLDPRISAEILVLLRSICRQDAVAVLCSLHQAHLAREYADRIVGLAHGRIVLDLSVSRFDAAAAEKLYGGAPALAEPDPTQHRGKK